MPTAELHLDAVFLMHVDERSNWNAGFGPDNPNDRADFDDFWRLRLADPTSLVCTILVADEVAGYIFSAAASGGRDVGYRVRRDLWGQGVATAALRQFLVVETRRPVFGRVVVDNHASKRVLEKCGFSVVGAEEKYSSIRNVTIVELIMTLPGTG